MILLTMAALIAAGPAANSPPKTVFTADEMAVMGAETKRACGYARPQELLALASDQRQKALACFIDVTVKRSGSFFPKTIEPGATIVGVSNYESLPIFELRFAASHERASVPKNETSDYDQLLSTRTCDDKWLGGLLDAGMEGGAQGGTIIVFKLTTEKGDVLSLMAVAQCFDPK